MKTKKASKTTWRRFRLKIERDTEFSPTLRFKKQFWVHLLGGEYFVIYQGYGGQWYRDGNEHLDYPSAEAAIAAELNQHFFTPKEQRQLFQRIQAKEHVFRCNDRDQSSLSLPEI